MQSNPTSIALLVIASSFLHALWNAILKRQKKPETAVVAITLVAMVASIAWMLVSAQPVPRASAIAWSALAGAFEAGYFITLAKALARAPLGVAYTIARGGALICIWPISVAFLGEKLTIGGFLGAVLVAGGLALVGLLGKRDVKGETRAEGNMQSARIRAGVAWACACAVFITGYHLVYKVAMDQADGSASVVVTVAFLVAGTLSVAWHGRAGMGQVLADARERPWGIVIAGVVSTASFAAFITALAHGGAGAIMTLRNTSVLFAQVFGWMTGERSRPAQVVGVVAVMAGAVLTAWK